MTYRSAFDLLGAAESCVRVRMLPGGLVQILEGDGLLRGSSWVGLKWGHEPGVVFLEHSEVDGEVTGVVEAYVKGRARGRFPDDDWIWGGEVIELELGLIGLRKDLLDPFELEKVISD